MKNILFYLSCFIMVLGISCTKYEDNPDKFNVEGGIVNFTNVDLLPIYVGDFENSSVSFDLENDGAAVSGVTLLKSFNGGTPITVDNVGSFPNSYSFDIDGILDGFGVTGSELVLGDQIIYSFSEYSAGGATYRSPSTLVLTVACLSELAGEYETTTTDLWCGNDPVAKTVTWSEGSEPGLYTIDDWGYGTYESCYGGGQDDWGTLVLKDFCNELTIEGQDAFGDSWSITAVEVDGSNLTITWTNTYGEGGKTTIVTTNPDGWPPLKTP